jgi:RNA polymerase sigma-70 factor (ECF subfamily)
LSVTQKRRAAPVSDNELVDRLRKGDSLAFDVLYDRYFKRVYHFVDKRLSNRADAEETTQEVFISVFNSIDSYRGEAPFVAWLFGITRRTVAARFKRKRHPTVSLDEEPNQEVGPARSLAAGPSPLESYECEERMAQMSRALEQKLSPEQRLLFRLHHLDEQPISEIAVTLEKSQDSIKSSLYRTRKLLLSR